MTDFLRDPDLDRLVADLNRETDPGREAAASTLGAPRRVEVEEGDPLEHLLTVMVRRAASDLHLLAGTAPVLRRDGSLDRLEEPPLGNDELRMLFLPYLGEPGRRRLERDGAADFSLRLAGKPGEDGHPRDWRFRVNLHRQRGRLAAAVRALPREVPTLAELNLPADLAELVETPRGLVLLTGPSGSGKSTTLAALVDEINTRRTAHILTIEDPIEYEHRDRRSVIEQIEVGIDTPSFATALRAALRQDPDVLLVGELRDLESVAIALTAAETGHLVLTTVHTNDVAQAIHRLVDVFGGESHNQIRHQLSMALNAVVSQQLLPRADGPGRVPAVEVLRATYPVRHHIRSNKLEKIYNEIFRGRGEGMISMEQSLIRLLRAGIITHEEARMRAFRPDELESLLRGREGASPL